MRVSGRHARRLGNNGSLGTNIAARIELHGVVNENPIGQNVTNTVSWSTPTAKFLRAGDLVFAKDRLPEMVFKVWRDIGDFACDNCLGNNTLGIDKAIHEQWQHVSDVSKEIDDFVAKVTELAEKKKDEIIQLFLAFTK